MPVQCNKWKCLGEVFETRAESTELLLSSGTHWNLDSDTAKRIERVHLKSSKYQHRMCNEPSLGLFHVQEHIKRAVPKSVTLKKELQTSNEKVKSVTGKVEDSTNTIQTLKSLQSFKNITQTSTKSRKLLEQLTKDMQ